MKTQTDVESSNSRESSPATEAKNPSSMAGKMKKDRRAIIGIIPVGRGYRSGNRCISGVRCRYRHVDGEKRPSERSRKESTQ